MIVDLEQAFNNPFDSMVKIDEKPGFFVIKNNKLPTMVLLKKLNIDVRKYK